ncbi:PRC-barrel domain-containing protein [Variovorax sp. LG9.2]|uniref:PRC-barrel domain-containing protein n=1 Tax=Variovorax sp. LG9.2 TaxID=3048626 RepID=UPI002B23AC6C|nr:PRC-barrel domain-containing protein [Variovorax sp. LG9.2]MEB0059662.1 PRC-barrel domain-containing protein [Variovorax sp. LG9.2]
MLRNFNKILGFTVAASDGSIGEIRDCHFDDLTWTIRFFLVETGAWLGGRKVLISPIAIHASDWGGKTLSASITRAQVASSPDVDTSRPVSRQHETEQFGYYGYPYYWGELQLWGGGPKPGMSLTGYGSEHLPAGPTATATYVDTQLALHRARGDDPNLRSFRAIEHYHVHATDGDIGHLESLLIDDETWTIRYLLVNTSDWWLGHRMLVAPPWIIYIDWLNATVSVDLTRQAMRDAPTYQESALLTAENERGLFEHYGRTDHRKLIEKAPFG